MAAAAGSSGDWTAKLKPVEITASLAASLKFWGDKHADPEMMRYMKRLGKKADAYAAQVGVNACGVFLDILTDKMTLPVPSIKRAKTIDPSLKYYFDSLLSGLDSQAVFNETLDESVEDIVAELFYRANVCKEKKDSWMRGYDYRIDVKEAHDNHVFPAFQKFVNERRATEQSVAKVSAVLGKWAQKIRQKKRDAAKAAAPPSVYVEPEDERLRKHLLEQRAKDTFTNQDYETLLDLMIIELTKPNPGSRGRDKHQFYRQILDQHRKPALKLLKKQDVFEEEGWDDPRVLAAHAADIAGIIYRHKYLPRVSRFVYGAEEDKPERAAKPKKSQAEIERREAEERDAALASLIQQVATEEKSKEPALAAVGEEEKADESVTEPDDEEEEAGEEDEGEDEEGEEDEEDEEEEAPEEEPEDEEKEEEEGADEEEEEEEYQPIRKRLIPKSRIVEEEELEHGEEALAREKAEEEAEERTAAAKAAKSKAREEAKAQREKDKAEGKKTQRAPRKRKSPSPVHEPEEDVKIHKKGRRRAREADLEADSEDEAEESYT